VFMLYNLFMSKTSFGIWNERGIDPLANPIGEFNARGGVDLVDYQNHNAYMEIAHPGLGKDQWAEIQKTLPKFEIFEDPASGQKLRVQRFNWPKDGVDEETAATIYNVPFSVPIDLPHLTYQHHLMAEALETPFMVIENPGYGESDKLTQEQKNELKQGKFKSVADSMLGVMKSLGITRLNEIGYSMGSDVAASIAANAADFGIIVENLFIMESPRVDNQNPIILLKNFASDSRNLKFTWANPRDPVLKEVAELKLGLPKGITTYGKALYKGGLKDDLVRALKTQPNLKVTIGTGDSSKISKPSANKELLSDIAELVPGRQVRRIVIPGESHSYGDSGKRYASLASLVLRQPGIISAASIGDLEKDQVYQVRLKNTL